MHSCSRLEVVGVKGHVHILISFNGRILHVATSFTCNSGFFKFRTSEIAYVGILGTIQQTLIRQLPGLPDLFRCPCITVLHMLCICPNTGEETTITSLETLLFNSKIAVSALQGIRYYGCVTIVLMPIQRMRCYWWVDD